ncbi:MAG: hypothetical protein OQK29_07250, partial [Ignavibacteriaceae bacterium]|nr:hypothetical protein [Ignavibacteriaceae bacterium]
MKIFYTIILIFLGVNISNAWVYPEHRQIALLAIEKLSPQYRSILEKLWSEARVGYESRLTEAVIDATLSIKPKQLDFASWPAISGDHSCSAEEMLQIVLESEWILDVADVAAQLKIDLAFAKGRNDRINSLRDSDLNLQNVDSDYATRAGSNNVHFLIPLANVNTDAITYGYSCVKDEPELNAIGVYVWYHYSALLKAARLSTGNLTPEERSASILAALAVEAFALHFLQDVFAAGHVAGSWGDASQRKGTHDYYNEHGLKINTWDGESVILTGDAWMRNEDAERAAFVVRLSIQQLLDAASGKQEDIMHSDEEKSSSPDNFNVSTGEFIPEREIDPNILPLLTTVLMKTPRPGLEQGLGEMPRFRAEVGTFVGFTPSMRGLLISGGFAPNENTIGIIGGIDAAFRFGVGLTGVLNEAGDGLAFIEFGWRQDGSSSTGFVDASETSQFGALFAAIPGRSSFSARLRLPYYLIPGDILILAPILFLADQEGLTNVGVTAVNGGLIPWQVGIATSIGRFQFVLGREVGIYFFGRTKERDALWAYSTNENGDLQLFI